jgi:hypothetical protein
VAIMFASGVIGEPEKLAAERLAWSYAVLNGRVSISAAAYEARERATSTQDGPPERVDRAAKAAIKAARGICRNSKERTLLINVVVYERAPRAILPVISRPADVLEAETLVRILRDLALEFGFVIDGAEN